MTRFPKARPVWLLASILAVTWAPRPARAVEIPGVPPQELVETVRIPLQNGQLHFGQLMGSLAERVGADGGMLRSKIDWQFDVAGALGKARLGVLRTIVRRYMAMTVEPGALVITIDRLQLRRDDKVLRGKFRTMVAGWFPDQAVAAALGYGVTVHRPAKEPVALEQADLPGRVVLLVHGLDEPGHLWHELRPRLLDAGYTVCEMTYPNDQAIDASAKLLDEHLGTMRRRGAQRITIIAHSMGGLLAREVLTSDRYYGGRADGRDGYPDVTRLIMVGTPNHGSQFARLDVAAELREQTIRLFSGDGLLFGSIFDGAGEARVDLIPKSEVLLRLNARPLPTGVKMTNIAGKASPVSDDKIGQLRQIISDRFPTQEDKAAGLADALKALSQGVGDGVVSIESARLAGVDDFTIVAGNHLSMIRNALIGHADDRVPPAVPIILERVKADE